METVTCNNCRRQFVFDPAKISDSPDNVKSVNSRNEGIVLVPCPHCGSPRTFLMNPEIGGSRQQT